ncbi:MAG: HDIG domain-containing protein [Verrucomicrobiae bacterium]|nr:HDIG domain-containing protein [Verrucomicrobiae bacterium]
MWRLWKRRNLVKEGLACEKQRRNAEVATWRETLETSWGSKIFLILLIGAALAALNLWGNETAQNKFFTMILIEAIYAISIVLLYLLHPKTLRRHSRFLLLYGAVLTNLLLAKIIGSFAEDVDVSFKRFPFIYMIPSAFAPMLISTLLGVRLGVVTVLFTSLFEAILLSKNFTFLLVVSLLTGLIAVLLTRNIRKRGHLIRAGLYVGLTGFICSLCFGLLLGQKYPILLNQAMWAAATGVMTGVLVNMLLPILEALFSITTNLSWLEMADLNHPLLRRLTLEAPGTYHHSLLVANLAEAAAQAVGANALQCRVSSYFHDVGKVVKPEYFTENQPFDHNPHDDLSPTMSTLIVMAHVKEGIDLAFKYKLPEPIIEAIREHHGTTLVSYFHARALRQHQDALVGVQIMNLREEDLPDVAEETFRYPGPKPQSRETAILMIADSVEASSRALYRPTPKQIEELVHSIIQEKAQDGQFDECHLSFKDLETIEQTLTFTLKTMLHSRIAYPKEERKGEGKRETKEEEKEKAPKDEKQNSSVQPTKTISSTTQSSSTTTTTPSEKRTPAS